MRDVPPVKAMMKEAKVTRSLVTALLAYVDHKSSCDLRGRRWPAECTCGAELLMDVCRREGFKPPRLPSTPR